MLHGVVDAYPDHSADFRSAPSIEFQAGQPPSLTLECALRILQHIPVVGLNNRPKGLRPEIPQGKHLPVSLALELELLTAFQHLLADAESVFHIFLVGEQGPEQVLVPAVYAVSPIITPAAFQGDPGEQINPHSLWLLFYGPLQVGVDGVRILEAHPEKRGVLEIDQGIAIAELPCPDPYLRDFLLVRQIVVITHPVPVESEADEQRHGQHSRRLALMGEECLEIHAEYDVKHPKAEQGGKGQAEDSPGQHLAAHEQLEQHPSAHARHDSRQDPHQGLGRPVLHPLLRQLGSPPAVQQPC